MLSTVRRRRLPATLVVSAALAAGFATTTIPAQASPASATTTTSVVAVTSTSAVVSTAATRAAAAKAAKAAAIHRAVVTRAAHVAKVRATAVRVAKSRLGSRYVAGRTGPHKFDCSGLAIYVVKHSLGRSLPHYSKSQYHVTKRVSRSHLRPGDLVFFFRHGAHHVGIYIGHGRMVNATNPHGGVRIDRVFSGWYGAHYSGAGRLI